MSTNDIFAFCLCIIIVMSAFLGAMLPDLGIFDIGGVIELPGGIDFIWDAVAAFMGLLTFTIPDMPIFISLFCWGITVLSVWALVRMPFGG